MNNILSRFPALSRGPTYTLLHLTGDSINLYAINNSCRAYVSHVSDGLFKYDFFWWIAEDDSVYLAVSGNRIVVSLVTHYLGSVLHSRSASVPQPQLSCEVVHLSRGVLTFNALVSKLFQQRKRTVGHKRSFGGSRK